MRVLGNVVGTKIILVGAYLAVWKFFISFVVLERLPDSEWLVLIYIFGGIAVGAVGVLILVNINDPPERMGE